jgi:hypothetical protein
MTGHKQRRFIIWHSVPAGVNGLDDAESVTAWLVAMPPETATPETLGVCGIRGFSSFVFRVCSRVRFRDGVAGVRAGLSPRVAAGWRAVPRSAAPAGGQSTRSAAIQDV